MKVSDVLDVGNLERHVAAGTVYATRHPSEPLRIYNYTQRCQFDGAWDHESRMCRGLIVADDGSLVARPFPKFHNLYEHGPESAAGPISLQPPLTVFDKLDGSLGIAYRRPSDGAVAWATRGSFTSEQALWATAWWQRNGGGLRPGSDITLLAEIIYPANRIVVDYGDRTGLVLLAVIHNESGTQIGPFPGQDDAWPGDVVECFGMAQFAHDVDRNDRPNAEGYVLLSADRITRVKVKSDEYVRLHKIVTGVSTVTVWEMLRAGDSLDALRDGVPDEFADWLSDTIDDLNYAHISVDCAARAEFEQIKGAPDRKSFAERAMRSPNRGLLFALLDGKDITDAVWKLVKPDRELPFAAAEDAA